MMREKEPGGFLPLHNNWFHILLSLAGAEQHGYAIMREVMERTSGAVRIWPATLYGSLKRLIADGLIEESDERPVPELDRVVAAIKGRAGYILIIVHTDSDPLTKSVWLSNYDLAEARAKAVKAYLVQVKIPAESIATVGAGPDNPIAPNNTREGKRRNRRVEIRFLPLDKS